MPYSFRTRKRTYKDYHMNPILCPKYTREVVYPRLKDIINLESIFDTKLDKLSEEWLESLKSVDFMKQHRILHDRREFENYLHPYPWDKKFKKKFCIIHKNFLYIYNVNYKL